MSRENMDRKVRVSLSPAKRLTKKQAKLVKARIKSPEDSLSELGQKADYDNPANVARALALPHVQDRMRALMDLNPATSLPGLLKKAAQGLEAKVMKIASFEGQITDEREYEDMPTQARFLEITAGWQGLDKKTVRLSLDAPPPMTLAQARDIILRAQCPPRRYVPTKLGELE